MSKFLAFCGLVLAFALKTPAHATPDTFIEIQDEAFGVSADEYFVLRTTFDNMGSYYETRFETFLVAISRTTGKQTAWHVSSATVTTQFSADGQEETRKLDYLPTAQQADPFAILAERGGVLWQVLSGPPALDKQPEPQEIGSDALLLSFANVADLTVSKPAMFDHMEQAIRQLATDIPDYPRHTKQSTRQLILERLDRSRPCDYSVAGVAAAPISGEPVYLVRMTCGYEEDFDHISLLVLAQEVLVSQTDAE